MKQNKKGKESFIAVDIFKGRMLGEINSLLAK